jgi:PPM family protein phosphatase
MSTENFPKNWFDRIRYAVRTDIGLKRAVNEDSWVIADGSRGGYDIGRLGMMFAVADGLGGHRGGDIASRMACDGILSYYEHMVHLNNNERKQPSTQAHQKSLTSIFHKIDENIRIKSHSDEALDDMGTTLSAMVLLKGQAVLSHVGDSRIYRLRGRELTRLTPDHTFVQEMIDEGEMTEDDVGTHPLRNMLTHALGTEEPLKTVFSDVVPVKPGDIFLLCSDGLTNMVSDKKIIELLGNKADPRKIVDRLVEKAIENGGKDNVTVIVVQSALFFGESREKRYSTRYKIYEKTINNDTIA